MASQKTIQLVIDGFTPDTLPLSRAAEYLTHFAKLAGPGVHFSKVKKGSAALTCTVEEKYEANTIARIINAQSGTGESEAIRGFENIQALMRADGTSGKIKDGNRKILIFPKVAITQAFSVMEEGEIEGVVVRIGGKDDTIHILLQDGERIYKCTATRNQAKELAKLLFETVRVSGRGKWKRSSLGQWELENFTISSFEAMEDVGLRQTFDRLRAIPNSGWDDISDPLAELDIIRTGKSEAF